MASTKTIKYENQIALNYFIRNNNENQIELMLKDPFINIFFQNEDGDTPLHLAVKNQNEKIVNLLLNQIKHEYFEGTNSLHVALKENKSVEYILEEMTKNNILIQKNINEETVIHAAVQTGNEKILNLLLKKETFLNLIHMKKYLTPIQLMVEDEHADLLLLLQTEFSNNIFVSRNKSGDTPLHLAIKLNKTKIAELLIYAESKRNVFSFHGECQFPIFEFTENEIIKSLLKDFKELGNLYNIKNLDGNTPLHLSILFDNDQIFEILKEKEFDIRIKNNENKNALTLLNEKCQLIKTTCDLLETKFINKY